MIMDMITDTGGAGMTTDMTMIITKDADMIMGIIIMKGVGTTMVMVMVMSTTTMSTRTRMAMGTSAAGLITGTVMSTSMST